MSAHATLLGEQPTSLGIVGRYRGRDQWNFGHAENMAKPHS